MHPTFFNTAVIEDKNGPVVHGDSGPGTSCKSLDLLNHLIRCRHHHVILLVDEIVHCIDTMTPESATGNTMRHAILQEDKVVTIWIIF